MSHKSSNRFLITSAACIALLNGANLAFAQDPILTDKHAPPVDLLLHSAQTLAGIEDGDAELVYRRPVHMLYSNVDVTFVKVRDKRTGEEQRIVLDKQLQQVDYKQLMEVERAIRFQIYGNMHPEVHRKILGGAEQAPIEVMIKVRVEEDFVDKTAIERGTMSEDQLRQRARQVRQAVESQTRQRLNAAIVRSGAAPVNDLNPTGPFVEMTLPANVAMTLAYDEDVLFIGPAGEERVKDAETITEALPLTRTNSAHYSSKGAGVRIAVLENGQHSEDENCFRLLKTQTTSGSVDSHMTRSLGIIGSKYSSGNCTGPWIGYAPEASILLANDSAYKDAYQWASDEGVNIVTMSWHYSSEETSDDLHSRDEYFDHWTTRYPYPTIFASAGNQAPAGAYASGKGFNFLGVGNVLMDGDGSRCNEEISGSSSYKNPTESGYDREIPEIAAPGSLHSVTGMTFGGTSCATPVSASIAACVMGANPSLKIWPEAVRAILQASANYQLADGENFSRYLDGKDGAGLLNAYYAVRTGKVRVTNNAASYFRGHDYGLLKKSSFSSNGTLMETWKARVATTNSKVRVAFTWNSKTTGSSSELDADLDIRVYNPDGILVTTSASWTSNNEFIEFKPTKPGVYSIRVKGYGIPSNFSSYFAVAWTSTYDCL